MMGLYGLRASRTGLNGFAHPSLINSAADANDHENDLQCLRMIVKNDSQLCKIFASRKKRVAPK
jgi:hypothetical protein